MAYSERFQKLLDTKKIPEYEVFPVTEDPIPLVNETKQTLLTWQAALVPALDVPNPSFFEPAARPNFVRIEPLIAIRGDHAAFFQLISEIAVNPEFMEDRREELLSTMSNMAIMANSARDPEAFNPVFYYKGGAENPKRGVEMPRRDKYIATSFT
ncbi:MAG TPA: hypothetical protein VK978_04625 [Candidatus Saccharimonadales bacterium]|nr:hypothetical protein [Candidatus Saccharimonadales bacterium]